MVFIGTIALVYFWNRKIDFFLAVFIFSKKNGSRFMLFRWLVYIYTYTHMCWHMHILLDSFESLPEIHEKVMGRVDFTVRDMRNMLCVSKDAYRVQTNSTQLNNKLKKKYSIKQLEHVTVPQNIIGSGLLIATARAINFSTGDLELKQKWFEILCSPHISDNKNIWPLLDGLEHASTLDISQTGLLQAILLSMHEFKADIVIQVTGIHILYKILAECVVFHPRYPKQSSVNNCRVLDEPLRMQIASVVMSACILGDTWKNAEWRNKHMASGMYLLLLLLSQSEECNDKQWYSLLPLSSRLGNGNVHIIHDLVENGCIEFLTHVLGSYAGVSGGDMFDCKTLEHARAINEHVLVLSHIVMHSPANLKICIEAECVPVLLEIYLSFYLKFDFLYIDQPTLLHHRCFLLDTTLYHICVVLIEYASTTKGSRGLHSLLKTHGFDTFPRLAQLHRFPHSNLHHKVKVKSNQLSDLVNKSQLQLCIGIHS